MVIIIFMMQKLKRLVQIQKKRYSKKGFLNCAIALTLLLGVMWIAVSFGKVYWPEEIQNKFEFLFIGSVLFHSSFSIISFLFYLPGYLGWSDYYAKHLINKKSTRPWERKSWGQSKGKLIKNLLMSQLVVYPFIIFITNIKGIKVRFDNFPDFSQVLMTVLIIYFIEDFFFYWAHRLFHTPYFYKMHKVHHEYDTLFTWVTEYFHPVDFFVSNLLPAGLAVTLLGSRVHCFTFFYWMCWKVLISSETHSGYDFEWTALRVVPLVAEASYHDHHHSHNVGNFGGNFYIWDLLFDTSGPYMDDFLKK